jgi:hypothetical protein
MVTGDQAAEIRRKVDEGWRGSALITWLCRLLEDRDERRRREAVSEPLRGQGKEG